MWYTRKAQLRPECSDEVEAKIQNLNHSQRFEALVVSDTEENEGKRRACGAIIAGADVKMNTRLPNIIPCSHTKSKNV